MKINNNLRLQNPVLHYKLDPGEPGLATPSRASQSIARVAAHEAANIRRFRREAMEKGGVVIYSFISLYLEQQGSFLAATSGKSTAVVIIPAEQGKKNKSITINNKENDNLLNKNKLTDELKVNKEDKAQNNFNIKNFKADEIERINNIIGRLENEKLTLENQSLNNNNSLNYERIDIYRENQIKEIEKRIQYLEQKKQIEKQKVFFDNLANSKNLSLKLVGLIYNNSNLNFNGTLIDTIV